VLLASRRKDDEVAKYLSDHDDGILAVSIEVSDLKAAKAAAESASHRKLKTY
jgi:4-hydroxyphenylpyruvate dioxygenase-like putative hemolysin